MNSDTISNSIKAAPLADPDDPLAEGERARKLSTEVEGVKALVEGIRLINDTVLVQVLFSLWESGFYEFSLTHPDFRVEEAADELHLDAKILEHLLEYLIGRGICWSADARFGLTEGGARLSNVVLRGTMNLYIGGYGALLRNIGPLLRKEMAQTDFNDLRSARHTVNGTEQLICIRTAQAVLQVLRRRKVRGVAQLACRTGEFLIELSRSEPSLCGIGIDRNPERIALARAKAKRHGLDSCLQFVTADIGRDPLPIEESTCKIEALAAIYFLHEVGRMGRERIVDLLRQIRSAYPGRLFLFAETLPVSPAPPGRKPPNTYSQIDYRLIHRLRRQGLPLPPAEWQSIAEEAGLKNLEIQDVYGSALYVAEL